MTQNPIDFSWTYNRCRTKPKFMENLVISPSYYEQPDPYANAPSCHVNLLELSRYAKQCGKKLVELTQEEVKKFSI